MLVVSLDACFLYEILVAAAKILACGIGFHKSVRRVEREDHGSGGPVGVVVDGLFDKDVKTTLFSHQFAERHRLEIGVVFAELENKGLFQIGVGIDVLVCGVVGFVDFYFVALFQLEYDLTIEDEDGDKN